MGSQDSLQDWLLETGSRGRGLMGGGLGAGGRRKVRVEDAEEEGMVAREREEWRSCIGRVTECRKQGGGKESGGKNEEA